MLAGAEIDGEGDLFIGEEVPADAFENVALDGGDADALPTETLGVPGFAVGSPAEDGVEASEEDEVVCWGGLDGNDRSE